jgi:hypothetical protein
LLVLPVSFVSCGESYLLVSWCAGGRCGMVSSDEDLGRSRRSGAEDWEWSSTSLILGGWTIRRSDDTVCGLHRARGARISWLSLKTKVNSLLVVWPQNHYDGLSVVWPKNHWDGLSVVWHKNRW